MSIPAKIINYDETLSAVPAGAVPSAVVYAAEGTMTVYDSATPASGTNKDPLELTIVTEFVDVGPVEFAANAWTISEAGVYELEAIFSTGPESGTAVDTFGWVEAAEVLPLASSMEVRAENNTLVIRRVVSASAADVYTLANETNAATGNGFVIPAENVSIKIARLG